MFFDQQLLTRALLKKNEEKKRRKKNEKKKERKKSSETTTTLKTTTKNQKQQQSTQTNRNQKQKTQAIQLEKGKFNWIIPWTASSSQRMETFVKSLISQHKFGFPFFSTVVIYAHWLVTLPLILKWKQKNGPCPSSPEYGIMPAGGDHDVPPPPPPPPLPFLHPNTHLLGSRRCQYLTWAGLA